MLPHPLFSLWPSIPLKQGQDWRDPDYRRWLLIREAAHAVGGALAVAVQLAFYPDGWTSRLAAASVVIAAVAAAEVIHTWRGQQPWKAAIDLAVWTAASALAAVLL